LCCLSERSEPDKGLTEEYLREHTVGELRPLSSPIEVVPYEGEWAVRFEAVAKEIGLALGAVALRVEHVGSTAVPGLAAKPVIDVVIAVADAADESSYGAACGFGVFAADPGAGMV
jgi:GrpB-like predicted nucleotidyltransferase (UPF0157 family)